MPQLSPLYYINTLSWAFAIISLLVFYVQSTGFPNILRIQLSRLILAGFAI